MPNDANYFLSWGSRLPFGELSPEPVRGLFLFAVLRVFGGLAITDCVWHQNVPCVRSLVRTCISEAFVFVRSEFTPDHFQTSRLGSPSSLHWVTLGIQTGGCPNFYMTFEFHATAVERSRTNFGDLICLSSNAVMWMMRIAVKSPQGRSGTDKPQCVPVPGPMMHEKRNTARLFSESP